MMNPLIDIILPNYNNGPRLREAIDSVLKQSFSDFNLILVDDGSTDGSIENIPADPRIKVFKTEHRGLVSALNFGLTGSSSKWIARFDGDDLMAPDRLNLQLHYALENKLDWVSCHAEAFDYPLGTRGYPDYIQWHNSLINEKDIVNSRFIECPMIHPTWFLKRSIFLQNGLYREGPFPEDYEFFLRAHNLARLGKVPKTLHYWRDSPDRLSRTNPNYSETSFRNLKAGYFPFAAQIPFFILGTGNGGRKLGRLLLEKGFSLKGFVDISPKKFGKSLLGLPIISRNDYITLSPRPVSINTVMSQGSRKLIDMFLSGHGLVNGKDYFHFQ